MYTQGAGERKRVRVSVRVKEGYVTWHVPHAAQNGPSFDLEVILSLLQALVHKMHYVVWCHVTSGKRNNKKNYKSKCIFD